MNAFDLQIHTTASDGRHSPAECVKMAKQNGLHTIAITDHDTVAGVTEGVAAGRELGVRVIPGIETSAEEHDIHILGLGIDVNNKELLAALQEFAEGREQGARRMVENFKSAGFAIDWDDVSAEATGAVVGRPHIARAIFKRPENAEKLKATPTMSEFFDAYLSESSPLYVRRAHIPARGAIALIRAAGGVAVWSHPPVPDFAGDCTGLEEFLRTLVSAGLDGVEVFNPAHAEADVQCLGRLAERHRLVASAGSDFHEARSADDSWPHARTVGDFPTYGRALDGILPALDEAMRRRNAVAEAA